MNTSGFFLNVGATQTPTTLLTHWMKSDWTCISGGVVLLLHTDVKMLTRRLLDLVTAVCGSVTHTHTHTKHEAFVHLLFIF